MNDTATTLPRPRSVEAGALNRKRFVYMRDVEHKTPRQIARELDFLEVYVRRQLKKHDEDQVAGKALGTTKGPH